jgi:hypothetical protein
METSGSFREDKTKSDLNDDSLDDKVEWAGEDEGV